MSYETFVARKLALNIPTGMEGPFSLPAGLFPHQVALVEWALRRGRCAIFADTGLGKTRMEIAWAHEVARRFGDVLILAPLAVAEQTVRGNAAMSRQGIPDYLVTMRNPGECEQRVTHDPEQYPVGKWQQVASPIWMDIDPNDTLQKESAREHDDERHICPLQLEVIRRGVDLWTNPGDVVLSPFAGIGSEGYVSLEMQRRFVGIELKESYFQQACENLKVARKQTDLFAA